MSDFQLSNGTGQINAASSRASVNGGLLDSLGGHDIAALATTDAHLDGRETVCLDQAVQVFLRDSGSSPRAGPMCRRK
jgi:hypothetical protein